MPINMVKPSFINLWNAYSRLLDGCADLIRQKASIILGMALSLNTYAEPVESAKTTVSLEGRQVTLQNSKQGCVLKQQERITLEVEMPWPCQFTLAKEGNAHVEMFQDVPIVMVMHIAPDSENARNCLSQSRAVRLIKGRLEIAPLSQSATCSTGVRDQKAYTGVFEW